MTENNSSSSRGREFDLTEPAGSFTGTARNVLLSPREFFGGIALRGSLKNPLVFGVVCLLVSSWVGGLINYLNVPGSESWITGNSPADQIRDLDLGVGDILAFGVFGVILAPIFALLQLYIYSGIVHLLVILFKDQRRRNFEATLRVYCYASVVALFSWIPLVGGIATLYGLYILIVGLREVHGSASRAATAQG